VTTKGKTRVGRHHPDRQRLRGFGYFKRTGPGLITGAADDDPAGIGTYAQVGATFRFDLVWSAPICLPLASAVQETSARLGLASGKGLVALVKARFSRPILMGAVIPVVSANAFIIGADLGSMAGAFRLLVPVPFVVLFIGFTAVILALEVFVSYERYSTILRWLALTIFAYVIELAVINFGLVEGGGGAHPELPSRRPAGRGARGHLRHDDLPPTCSFGRPGRRVEERKAGRCEPLAGTRSERCESTSSPG
jgi:Mn2+/Fe2+ NRAMP family transporter